MSSPTPLVPDTDADDAPTGPPPRVAKRKTKKPAASKAPVEAPAPAKKPARPAARKPAAARSPTPKGPKPYLRALHKKGLLLARAVVGGGRKLSPAEQLACSEIVLEGVKLMHNALVREAAHRLAAENRNNALRDVLSRVVPPSARG